jgi:hypothetical protein
MGWENSVLFDAWCKVSLHQHLAVFKCSETLGQSHSEDYFYFSVLFSVLSASNYFFAYNCVYISASAMFPLLFHCLFLWFCFLRCCLPFIYPIWNILNRGIYRNTQVFTKVIAGSYPNCVILYWSVGWGRGLWCDKATCLDCKEHKKHCTSVPEYKNVIDTTGMHNAFHHRNGLIFYSSGSTKSSHFSSMSNRW